MVNVIGNYTAALAVAKLEGSFNRDQALQFLGGPVPITEKE